MAGTLTARVDTNLKPSTQQSADIDAAQIVTIKKGQSLGLIEYFPFNGHYYVALDSVVGAIAPTTGKNASAGKPGYSRGFVYGPSVTIDDATKTSADSSKAPALAASSDKWALSMDFPSRIVRYCLDKGYQLASRTRERNIIYIEGLDRYGRPNADRPNEWNDLRILLSFDENTAPYFPSSNIPMLATTEPGDRYTYNPMTGKGAFRIAFGEHKAAWHIDTHGNDAHAALRQIGPITGYRDKNQDFQRTGDALDTGLFTINQHGPYTVATVGISSAGCLVGANMAEHLEFMQLLSLDPRYLADKYYRFNSIIIDGSDFASSKWGYR